MEKRQAQLALMAVYDHRNENNADGRGKVGKEVKLARGRGQWPRGPYKNGVE